MKILLYGYGKVGKNFEEILTLLDFDFDVMDDSKKTIYYKNFLYDFVVICTADISYKRKMLEQLKLNEIKYENISSYINDDYSIFIKSYLLKNRIKFLNAIANDEINSLLLFAIELTKKEMKTNFPHILFSRINYIYIETTTQCNLKCPHCYRTNNEYKAKNKYMEYEIYKKIIDELPSIKQFVLCPQNIGEPTLHPKFLDMLRYAKNSNKFSKIEIHSNLLTFDTKYYKELFVAGLDLLIVSIDSLDEIIIEKTRTGTKLDKLLKNLNNLLIDDEVEEKIIIRISVSKINELELESLLAKLDQMNVKHIHLAPVVDIYDAGISVDIKSVTYWKTLTNKFSFDIMVIDPYENRKENLECVLFEGSLNFNVLGHVVPCCLIYDHEKINFGTIENSSLKHILSDKSYIKFKNDLYETIPNSCRNCIFHPKTKELS